MSLGVVEVYSTVSNSAFREILDERGLAFRGLKHSIYWCRSHPPERLSLNVLAVYSTVAVQNIVRCAALADTESNTSAAHVAQGHPDDKSTDLNDPFRRFNWRMQTCSVCSSLEVHLMDCCVRCHFRTFKQVHLSIWTYTNFTRSIPFHKVYTFYILYPFYPLYN